MNVTQLNLVHFRNYNRASFSFEPNCIHILYGRNAQGKTNMIEAIYYLSHLHSFRTNVHMNLIEHGQETLIIDSKVETNQRNENLCVVIGQQKKQLFRYKNPVTKYSDFVGIVNAILFCPDDMMIFSQPKKYRRKFIDMELIKLSKTYTATLSHYQNLLKERNILLKKEKVNLPLLEVYTSQMIADQKIILLQRKQFISDLISKAKALYPFFCNQKEEIDAHYETFVSFEKDLEEELNEVYQRALTKDLQYKQTTIGIHKDDVVFYLNGSLIQEVASQGQKRSYLLAIKLALAQLIYEKSHQYPILLLDDVFSELDNHRKQQLIQRLPKNMQIFITTTEPVDLRWMQDRKYKIYEIEQGSIKEVKYV